MEEQVNNFEKEWLENTYGCEFVKNENGEWTPKKSEQTAYETDCKGGECE
jgi:hypothetical protein